MQLPSLNHLASGFKKVLNRFPAELFFATIGTLAAIVLIEVSNHHQHIERWCIRIMMMANIGLVLSLAATLLAESKSWVGLRKVSVRLVGILFTLFFLWIIDPNERQVDIIRFILLSLSFHLLVSCIAFFNGNQVYTFWHFNKSLFLQFLTAALYSFVLSLGLFATIGSINLLFNVNFESDTYLIIWVCITGLFNTIFFLSGVPENPDMPPAADEYPKGLKIFTQYVLIPLATVYVTILLLYEIKILLEWNLPKGLVSYLILGYAVFGILSILLIYPIRNLQENKWIKTYSKSFYYLLIPLLLLLFLAVGKRITDYGITENRYFILVIALWLTFITGWFLISSNNDIRIIPISLAIACLLASYGPQSAFDVSKRSQEKILLQLFQKNNSFKNGRIQPLNQRIDSLDAERIFSSFDYLMRRKGLISLQNLLDTNLRIVQDSLAKGNHNEKYQRWEIKRREQIWLNKYLNLNTYSHDVISKKYYYENPNIDSVFAVTIAQQDILTVQGFDYLIEFHSGTDKLKMSVKGLNMRLTQQKDTLFLLEIADDILKFNMQNIVDSLSVGSRDLSVFKTFSEEENLSLYRLPQEMLTFPAEGRSYKGYLIIKNMRWNFPTNGKPDLLNFDGKIGIKKSHPRP
jgi:hypothetical protein